MLKVKNVNYDEHYTSGCETCDWGSSYVNEIEIILEDGTYTNIKVDKMYEYLLSESDYMQLIANSNDLEDFLKNIFNYFKNDHLSWKISLERLTITVNGENIDILKTIEQGKLIKN